MLVYRATFAGFAYVALRCELFACAFRLLRVWGVLLFPCILAVVALGCCLFGWCVLICLFVVFRLLVCLGFVFGGVGLLVCRYDCLRLGDLSL